MKLCAFADEASAAISGQIAALQRNGISLLEIRGVNGKNIKDVTLVDVGLGSQAGRRLILDGAAKDIAGRNLGNAKLFAHTNSLGTLARTGRAEKNQIHVSTSCCLPIRGSPCGDA